MAARPFHGLPNSGDYSLRPGFNLCVRLCHGKYLNVLKKLLFYNLHVALCYKETKKDKHISFTLPDELNVSFEEVAQWVQTHNEHDETQEESGSTAEIVEAEHEGSTVETGDINFNDDDDEDYEMPLTQNTHRPRYVNSSDENEDSLDSKDSKDTDATGNSDSRNEGDIFSKWAEKKKGDELQR